MSAAPALSPDCGGGGDHDSELARVCWAGMQLIDAGWRPARLMYCPESATAVLSAETPGGRVIVCRSSAASGDNSAGLRCGGDIVAMRLADAVARLAHRHPLDVEYLSWYWTAHTPRRPQGRIADHIDHIPDPSLSAQPPALRRCYWLLSTLVCQMNWRITDFGSPVAGGGFVADIPDEVVAIFPAGMKRDGTVGAELAWSVRGLRGFGFDYLNRQNRFTLDRARASIGLQASGC